MDNESKRAITRSLAGHPLSEFPFSEWTQHYPIIGPDLILTGGTADVDTSVGMANYRELAMIDAHDAIKAGWDVERDEDGNYGCAEPPK